MRDTEVRGLASRAGPRPAADPLVGFLDERIILAERHSICVIYSRRHLPHLYEMDQPVFVTWRLFGSLPPFRAFPPASLTSGQAFAALDRLLDQGQSGPLYLRHPDLADMVVEAILYNAQALGHYSLHAFVAMPNHVHLLLSPHDPFPKLTKSLKGITAKKANEMLRRTGQPFWQEESDDHLVRGSSQFDRIRLYIEENPAKAGLGKDAAEYRWSSRATGGAPADQGVRPTLADVL